MDSPAGAVVTQATFRVLLDGGCSQPKKSDIKSKVANKRKREEDTTTTTNKAMLFPQPRQGHAMVLHDDGAHIYVHAGRVDSVVRRQRQFVDDLWRYSLTDNSWEQIEAKSAVVPKARHNHSALVYKGSMWVFGGSSSDVDYHNDVWKFDFADQTWTLIQPKTPSDFTPFKRHGHTATLWGSKMVVFGGKSDAHTKLYFNDTHLFDMDTLEWSQLQVNSGPENKLLPHPRCWHSAVRVEHFLVCFGGFWFDPSGRRGRGMEYYFGDVWVLDLIKGIWTEASPKGAIPHKRNRHAAALLSLSPSLLDHQQQQTPEVLFRHQMWIQGGNFYQSGSRQGVFFDDSYVLEMTGRDPSKWIWKRVSVSGERVPQRGHHTAVIVNRSNLETSCDHEVSGTTRPDSPVAVLLLFGGEQKRVRWNDVLLVELS